MTDQEVQESRAFYLAAPVLLPMLERRKRIATEKLLSAFREGRTDLLALTSELNAYVGLEQEIKQLEANYKTLEEQNANRRK